MSGLFGGKSGGGGGGGGQDIMQQHAANIQATNDRIAFQHAQWRADLDAKQAMLENQRQQEMQMRANLDMFNQQYQMQQNQMQTWMQQQQQMMANLMKPPADTAKVAGGYFGVSGGNTLGSYLNNSPTTRGTFLKA